MTNFDINLSSDSNILPILIRCTGQSNLSCAFLGLLLIMGQDMKLNTYIFNSVIVIVSFL